jgi:hypothetical protein
MKRYKYLFLAMIPAVLAVSCKKDAFVKANINPSTLTTVDPGAQFLYASVHVPNDFEYYYDYYRAMMPWMQMITGSAGNGLNFTTQSGNFNYRYGNFYGNVGLALSDIPHLIANMPSEQKPGRADEAAIASIVKAYYAFYVSDINGSIPYAQAFQARYGGTLTPVYDEQQNLFDTLDIQIASAVATLENTSAATQVLYGANDPFYGNLSPVAEAEAWAKAGNALRLKIALRQLKRNPTGVAAIVAAVLKDSANLISSVADSWVLLAGPNFATQQSNFNPQTFLAAAPLVNFMNANADPREPAFFRPNVNGAYFGSPTSPDTCQAPYWQNLYKNSADTFSAVQHRLFAPNYDEGDGNGPGSGVSFFPVITYAEVCFIRADLAARGVTTENAQALYTAGVTASIQFYDARAKGTGIAGYAPVTAGQISAYLGMPGVLWNAGKATELIACQAHIDFYRQPNEAWAWWKRTGFPNTTSVIRWSTLSSNGTVNVLNRRVALTLLPTSDANYANQQAAYAQMATDPNFGGSPGNAQGRIWWDMP